MYSTSANISSACYVNKLFQISSWKTLGTHRAKPCRRKIVVLQRVNKACWGSELAGCLFVVAHAQEAGMRSSLQKLGSTPQPAFQMDRAVSRRMNATAAVSKSLTASAMTTGQAQWQVSEDGELVWELHFPEFRHQKQRGVNKTYIYKASFVYPSDN